MNSLFNHRSIRKYKEKEVEQPIIDKILKAAIRASNTGNMQVYSIIVTKEPAIKEKLWDAHFQQEMVKKAPIVMTFCADINRFNKWCKQRNAVSGYDNFLWFYNATIDATLASQNASLAAEEEGLGICYLGTTTYMASTIIEILDLPKGVVPVTSIVVGYPDEHAGGLTDRLPLDAVVHYEKYSDYSDEDIEKNYKELESTDFTRKLIEENQTENLAQIFTDKRYKKTDNVFFSKRYFNVIKNQGFFNS